MLVLASTSPRRQQLLSLLGVPFQILSAEVDESPEPEEEPRQYVLRLAHSKAKAVLPKVPPGSLVVAADTAVVFGDQILGKPEGAQQAVEILKQLRGRSHQVHTGLVVMSNTDGKTLMDWCVTKVQMRDYGDDEILAYVQTGDAYDKAGAYAIQHIGFNPVERLEGCYANVVGLPVCTLTVYLRNFGMQIDQICPGIGENNPDHNCKIKL